MVWLAGVAPVHGADFPPLKAEHPPYFTADAAITLDSDARPGLTVTVTIPYSELQWLRLERGFGAAVMISVSLEPRGRGRVYGDAWERRVVVPGFPATHSPNAALVEKRSFALRPERYRMRVAVRDVHGEEESRASEPLVVPDYSRIPVGFADLELGVADSAGGFQANPTRRFGLDVQRLAARAVLFDRRPGPWPRSYSFRYRILDDSGGEVVTGEQRATLRHSADSALVRPSTSDLFLGSYHFEVALDEDRSRWRVERSFEVEQSGPPRGREFERMLEALAYIAEAQEVQALRALPPDQQARGWEEFWARRDPTPDTPLNEAMIEFFRRVRYADQHFQGMGPGWRSDMGRIYIKFGPPDQIETRPASTTSPLLEIWYYNQPYRRFVFADREGFGRFVLMNPAGE
jgi:GWxTD domain-containing protein